MIELTVFAIVSFILIGILLSGMILYAKKRLISTKPCKIGINHNEDLSKFVEGGRTLLVTLAEQGIALPSPCGGKATCKQCKVQVLEGGGDILETDRSSFSPKQLKEGGRLACQCQV
ncbi:MAG: 2Fe-2S iron-sulfur cluster binding domain-containing protein, partial [Simkania sp.]|nr:2Fe-2S iron-sulfur cluster binding domain-containing protein [Simkania sp.]